MLTAGFNRRGNGISAKHWPNGAGFTAYKWQLDGGAWSAETAITNQIVLTNLVAGSHQVAIVGKNDAGMYQDDPLLGTNAVITVSRPWTVAAQNGVTFELDRTHHERRYDAFHGCARDELQLGIQAGGRWHRLDKTR